MSESGHKIEAVPQRWVGAASRVVEHIDARLADGVSELPAGARAAALRFLDAAMSDMPGTPQPAPGLVQRQRGEGNLALVFEIVASEFAERFPSYEQVRDEVARCRRCLELESDASRDDLEHTQRFFAGLLRRGNLARYAEFAAAESPVLSRS